MEDIPRGSLVFSVPGEASVLVGSAEALEGFDMDAVADLGRGRVTGLGTGFPSPSNIPNNNSGTSGTSYPTNNTNNNRYLAPAPNNFNPNSRSSSKSNGSKKLTNTE